MCLEFGAALDFCSVAGFTVGIDGLFGKVIGTTTGSAEDEPAVAWENQYWRKWFEQIGSGLPYRASLDIVSLDM